MSEVLLSEYEKSYIVQGIENNFREDGRSCRDMRHITITTGVISNASGSSRLQLGETDIMVGVKAEIGEPNSISPERGIVKFSVDCSAGASPEFEGRSGSDFSNSVSHTLAQLYDHSSALDFSSLCIIPNEHCWILYVDAIVSITTQSWTLDLFLCNGLFRFFNMMVTSLMDYPLPL
jgi:exosome complex component RRP42